VGTQAFAASLRQRAPARTQIHGVPIDWEHPMDLSAEPLEQSGRVRRSLGEGGCWAKPAKTVRSRLDSDLLIDVPRTGLDAPDSHSLAAPYPARTYPRPP